MGTLYRKYCVTCDGDDETNVTFDGFAGAAITDSKCGGEIVTNGHVAYLTDDVELVALPHPVESHALQSLGVTWDHAALRGRLIYVHNLICRDCGTANTTASLHTGGVGCLVGLLLAAAMIVINIFLLDLHFIAESVLVWGALFAPSMVIDRYVGFRYRGNAEPFRFRGCNQCNGTNVVSIARARRHQLTCPRCHNDTMNIEIAGKS